jgi:5-methylcytosine-specific restriction endonuclease McrA
MEQVLLLNITYEPLRIINWRKAIIMLTLGKVEVLEQYNREIHSVSFSVRLPSVVRLLRFVKKPKTPVKFSRQNIYIRDNYKCQYCGRKLPPDKLTWDHVIPKARGGKTEWENIVTCCIECNRRKGGKVLSETWMKLVRKPRTPDWLPALKITLTLKVMPQSWRDYLYWNIELEE